MDARFEEVISSLHAGQVLRAKELLHSILFSVTENTNYQKETLEEAILLNLSILFNEKKIKDAHELLLQFFNALKKQNELELLLYFCELLKNDHYSFKNHQTLFLEFEAWAYFAQGKVEKSFSTYLKLIKVLDQKKHVNRLELLLVEIIKIFPREPELFYFQAKCFIHQGKSDEFLRAVLGYFSLEAKAKRYQMISLLIKEVYLAWDDSKLVLEYLDVLLCHLPKTTKEYIRLVNTTINHAAPNYFFQLVIYLNFAKKYKLAKELHVLAQKHFRREYRQIMKAQPVLVSRIEFEKSVRELIETTPSPVSEIQSDKLDILLLKLKFAQKYRNIQDEERLSGLIQSIDPFFVLEEAESALPRSAANVHKHKSQDPEIIFEELLTQISYYSGATRNEEDRVKELKMELGKIIDFSMEELSENRLTDYIVMLHSFKFHDLALNMIAKWKDLNPDFEKEIKSFLEISYLEVSVNQELKKHYDNLNLLSAINTKLPLSKEEKICFMYLEAETLMQLKRESEALYIFKKINQLEPGYRLSQLRIRQIEKA